MHISVVLIDKDHVETNLGDCTTGGWKRWELDVSEKEYVELIDAIMGLPFVKRPIETENELIVQANEPLNPITLARFWNKIDIARRAAS